MSRAVFRELTHNIIMLHVCRFAICSSKARQNEKKKTENWVVTKYATKIHLDGGKFESGGVDENKMRKILMQSSLIVLIK